MNHHLVTYNLLILLIEIAVIIVFLVFTFLFNHLLGIFETQLGSLLNEVIFIRMSSSCIEDRSI